MAAQRTVEKNRFVHSLHAYFMRPGDPSVPIVYQVERIRDGSSFATRWIVAIQHGRPIFSMSASFQVEEDGFDHQVSMPPVTPPEELMGEKEFKELFLARAPAVVRKHWSQESPVKIAPAKTGN